MAYTSEQLAKLRVCDCGEYHQIDENIPGLNSDGRAATTCPKHATFNAEWTANGAARWCGFAHKIANLLNEMLDLDREATKELLFARVPCNDALSQSPRVQITNAGTVGLLGVLNGLAKEEHGVVIAVFDECSGRLLGFKPKVLP